MMLNYNDIKRGDILRHLGWDELIRVIRVNRNKHGVLCSITVSVLSTGETEMVYMLGGVLLELPSERAKRAASEGR